MRQRHWTSSIRKLNSFPRNVRHTFQLSQMMRKKHVSCCMSQVKPSLTHGIFAKTIRISTMHVLRMIVAKAEETHGLRINFVLCFSTLVFYITTENLLLPLETRSLSNFAPHGM